MTHWKCLGMLWFYYNTEFHFTLQIPKVDRKAVAHSYSKRSHSYRETHDAPASRPSLLRLEMEDIVFMAPCSDLSLPPGGGFRIDTISGPKYLVCWMLNVFVFKLLCRYIGLIHRLLACNRYSTWDFNSCFYLNCNIEKRLLIFADCRHLGCNGSMGRFY